MAKNCCPSSSSSAGRLRQEPSITKNCCTSSSKCGCSKWKSRAQVAESCLKVRRVDCVTNAPVPQGRLRHQRASFRRVVCVTNAPVPQGRLRNQRNVAQKPWGGPPSCDPAPLTTSLRGLWVSGNAGTGQWWNERRGGDPKTDRATQGAATQKPTCERRNSLSNLGAKGGDPRTLASRRHWLPQVVAATAGVCWTGST